MPPIRINDHLPPVADAPGGLSPEQFDRIEQLLMPGYYASKIVLAMYERQGFGIDTNGDVTFPPDPPAEPSVESYLAEEGGLPEDSKQDEGGDQG